MIENVSCNHCSTVFFWEKNYILIFNNYHWQLLSNNKKKNFDHDAQDEELFINKSDSNIIIAQTMHRWNEKNINLTIKDTLHVKFWF